jgi:hypothetical protein
MIVFSTLSSFLLFHFTFVLKTDMLVVAIFVFNAPRVVALSTVTAHFYDASQFAEALVIVTTALPLGSRTSANAAVALCKRI